MSPHDFNWTGTFLEECDKLGCDISFVCVHWEWVYGPGRLESVQEAVNSTIAIAQGKPIWVDNLAVDGTVAEQMGFMDEVIPWLEQHPQVQRYGYVSQSQADGLGLLNADNTISDLGVYYANLPV